MTTSTAPTSGRAHASLVFDGADCVGWRRFGWPALLVDGALSTFERLGFERSRLIGKRKWVVTLTAPSSLTPAA